MQNFVKRLILLRSTTVDPAEHSRSASLCMTYVGYMHTDHKNRCKLPIQKIPTTAVNGRYTTKADISNSTRPDGPKRCPQNVAPPNSRHDDRPRNSDDRSDAPFLHEMSPQPEHRLRVSFHYSLRDVLDLPLVPLDD